MDSLASYWLKQVLVQLWLWPNLVEIRIPNEISCDLSQYNYKSNDIAIVWLIEVRIRYVIKHN